MIHALRAPGGVLHARCPADTIKVLLQTQSTTNPVYSGMMDATKKTIQAEGLAGLYKGVASPLAGEQPWHRRFGARAVCGTFTRKPHHVIPVPHRGFGYIDDCLRFSCLDFPALPRVEWKCTLAVEMEHSCVCSSARFVVQQALLFSCNSASTHCLFCVRAQA